MTPPPVPETLRLWSIFCSLLPRNKVTDAPAVPGNIRYRFQTLSKDQSPFELVASLTTSIHKSPLSAPLFFATFKRYKLNRWPAFAALERNSAAIHTFGGVRRFLLSYKVPHNDLTDMINTDMLTFLYSTPPTNTCDLQVLLASLLALSYLSFIPFPVFLESVGIFGPFASNPSFVTYLRRNKKVWNSDEAALYLLKFSSFARWDRPSSKAIPPASQVSQRPPTQL